MILQIVREVEEGLPRKEACDKYQMAYGTLCAWMSKLGSPVYHLTKKSQFSNHLKRNIVDSLREGRMTKDEAVLIHKMCKNTLGRWLREAKKEDNDLACSNQDIMPSKTISHFDSSDLVCQLAEARLKIKALETMIDIAEEQFKIPIRKKSGAKQ